MAARGTKILISAQPQGKFIEGVVSGTPKPGTCMEITSTAINGSGKFTWQAKAGDGGKGLVAVLLEDRLQGRTVSDAYVSGTTCFLYCPIPGEELNVLKVDITGTGSALEDLSVGEGLKIVDGKVTASNIPPVPESVPFISMEALVDQSADELVPVIFTGY